MSEPLLRPPSLLGLASYLAGSVARVGHASLVAALGGHGLRLPQYAVLAALHDFGALAPHELATRLHTDRSHISTYLEALVDRGYVQRIPDPADRRRQTVTLTSHGATAFAELQAAAAASQDGLLDDLSAAEQHTLRTLLTRVITSADAASRHSPT